MIHYLVKKKAVHWIYYLQRIVEFFLGNNLSNDHLKKLSSEI